MKRAFTFTALVIMLFSTAQAQTGYWYKSEFIELKACQKSIYYIEPKIDSLNNNPKQLISDLETRYKVLSHISDEGLIVEATEKPANKSLYVSPYYQTPYNDNLMILPEISLRMEDGFDIDGIALKYEHILTLSYNEKDRYLFKCMTCSSDDVLNLARSIHDEKGVKWCEPVMLSGLKPCNTLYPQQYYLHNTEGPDIKAEGAWTMVSSSSNVSVAVIDDGVDDAHEDMGLCVQYGYTVDDNGTSWGRPKNANNIDCKGHGTCCAGIISAADNSIGIKGVAPSTTIIPVNIFPHEAYIGPNGVTSNGGASSAEVAAAIRWAYPLSDILNCSWAMNPSNDVEDAINEALSLGRNGKGCIVIAASGNHSYTSPDDVAFPASIDGVIAVGAIKKNGEVALYSQGGANLDLVAFGGYYDIMTIDRMGALGYSPSNYQGNFDGTSAACAQVSGVAALMLSANNDLTESQVRQILLSSCQKSFGPYCNSVWNSTVGEGLLDAEKAVFKSLQLEIAGPTVPEDQSVYSIIGLGSATYPVIWSWQIPCSIPIIQNSSTPNQCTISNANKDYIANTLIATVEMDGATRTVCLPIHSGINFSGTYSQNGGITEDENGNIINYNSIPSTPISDGGAAYIHQGLFAKFSSELFANAIFYNENGTLNNDWLCNGITARYIIPNGSNTIGKSFIVKCLNSYDVFKFTVYKQIDGMLPVDPQLIRIQTRQGSIVVSYPEHSLRQTEVSIANVNTGAVMYKGKLTCSSQTISTKDWKPGLYILRASDNNESVSKKFYVK